MPKRHIKTIENQTERPVHVYVDRFGGCEFIDPFDSLIIQQKIGVLGYESIMIEKERVRELRDAIDAALKLMEQQSGSEAAGV
ncbi:MAG: hypothetical protein J5I81_12765 [Nitrococcus mobilis]|nr:hypothetical protein [Nitrococcus mobilis]